MSTQFVKDITGVNRDAAIQRSLGDRSNSLLRQPAQPSNALPYVQRERPTQRFSMPDTNEMAYTSEQGLGLSDLAQGVGSVLRQTKDYWTKDLDPTVSQQAAPAQAPLPQSATSHAADTLMNRGIDNSAPSAQANLTANMSTMFGGQAGYSAAHPLTLDQQRQMGMEPQRVDQWGKPLAEAAGPKMETRADGLQGLATTYSPGSQPSLRSSAGVAPEPITPQQAPSTAANTGLPRMIANERTGGGINVMPQGAGTFS